ncbi:MAG: nitroreductase [Dysgonamonadaceae bacterium]|jgi:nitroreductase|nr:nitroreductase [Dysgonamonadaceae bacterium]
MKKLLLILVIASAFISCTQKAPVEEPVVPQPSKSQIVYENIMSRRSIRAYKQQPVPKAQLDTIVQCAINAPSAMNAQSWQVRVIQSPELMAKIHAVNPDFYYGAPSLIVIAKEKNNGISPADCGFLTQNILLMAEAMDLGTVVLGNMGGIPNNPKAADIMATLDLPDTHEVIFAVAIGYKNETPGARPRDTGKIKFIN